MKSIFISFAVLNLCFASCISAFGDKLTSRDFAYGYMLELKGEGSVYSLPLPHEVYTRVRRADLGDVRIFNGTGEEVPYGLRTIKEEDVHRVGEVSFFPLYRRASGGEDLTLSVRRSPDGTIIDLDSSHSSGKESVIPTGYLLDLGEERRVVSSLEVFWQTDSEHATSSITIEQSTDLQRWFPLVRRATLVDLEYGGNRVVQRKVMLPRTTERYLRISWLDGSAPLTLEKVTSLSQPLISKRNLQWASLYNGSKSIVSNELAITYSSNYRLPVRNARVRFNEQNSIINGSIQSRENDEQGWRERCRGVFYMINVEGQSLQSEPCAFSTTTDRQWRLLVHDDGAGLKERTANVMIDLGWQSDELIFLARGTKPFMLAYGSGRLENEAGPVNSKMVLSAVQQQGGGVVTEARLGKRIELGGEKALIPPPPPKPWKTWLLWGVLVAGVLVMAVMAVGLVREFKAGEEKR